MAALLFSLPLSLSFFCPHADSHSCAPSPLGLGSPSPLHISSSLFHWFFFTFIPSSSSYTFSLFSSRIFSLSVRSHSFSVSLQLLSHPALTLKPNLYFLQNVRRTQHQCRYGAIADGAACRNHVAMTVVAMVTERGFHSSTRFNRHNYEQPDVGGDRARPPQSWIPQTLILLSSALFRSRPSPPWLSCTAALIPLSGCRHSTGPDQGAPSLCRWKQCWDQHVWLGSIPSSHCHSIWLHAVHQRQSTDTVMFSF